MISFSLECEHEHAFDGWFRNGDDFDDQKARGLVSCPACGSTRVEKALMAPALSTGRKREQLAIAASQEQKRMMSELRRITRKLKDSADYVGDRFAEEARKIHFGEADARGIYGEATIEDAKGLVDDGVEFMPLPDLPEDKN